MIAADSTGGRYVAGATLDQGIQLFFISLSHVIDACTYERDLTYE